MEKYSSGSRGSPAKGLGWIKPVRGFESLLLRQSKDYGNYSIVFFYEENIKLIFIFLYRMIYQVQIRCNMVTI